MNRRLTGLLAWCALGVVVAIPSTDIILKNAAGTQDDSGQAAQIEAANRVGPQLPSGGAAPDIDLGVNSATPVSQPLLSEIDAQPTKVAESDDQQSRGSALPPIVPLAASDGQDADVATGPELTENDLDTAPVAPQDVAESEPLPPEAPALQNTPSIQDQQDMQLAAIEPVDAPDIAPQVAPVPMPAISRPAYSAPDNFVRERSVENVPMTEDDSRSRINVIEVSRRPVVAPTEPVNQPFWGDDPQYRAGQRLDTFNAPEVVRSDDASDSAFYEIWQSGNRPAGFRSRGSFSEQLPARRGSAVRLDLLQNQ